MLENKWWHSTPQNDSLALRSNPRGSQSKLGSLVGVVGNTDIFDTPLEGAQSFVLSTVGDLFWYDDSNVSHTTAIEASLGSVDRLPEEGTIFGVYYDSYDKLSLWTPDYSGVISDAVEDKVLDYFPNVSNVEVDDSPFSKTSRWKTSRHQSVLDQNAGQNLEGLPNNIKVPGMGPVEWHSHGGLQNLAQQYTSNTGIGGDFPTDYLEVDPETGAQIAQEYEAMEHNPDDPEVQQAYNAFAQETLDQYNDLVNAGYVFEFYPSDQDPYPNSPREAIFDLHENRHMYVYPTDEGFGGDEEYPNHPLLGDSGVVWTQTQSDGSVVEKPVTYNDLFRGVHDAYGHGKEGVGFRAAQPLSSNVLTPKGWKKMGDVVVGDEVVNPEGGISKVTRIFPHGQQKIYKVTMNDGSSTRCDSDHRWKVSWQKRDGWMVKHTDQIADSISIRKHRRKLSIPLVRNVEFRARDLPLDPYVLGVILGYGYIGNSVTVFSDDSEIIEEVKTRTPSSVTAKRRWNRNEYALTTKIGSIHNPIKSALTELGLKGKRSFNKFVPDTYKFNSHANRLEVLRGLMDTDGNVNTNKDSAYTNAKFRSVSKQLSEDVVFLARSLGGTARINYTPEKQYDYRGEIRTILPIYTVLLTLPSDTNPFKLTRKANSLVRKNEPSRAINSVEEDGYEEIQCISVDHPNQLYITDDFIVTMNSGEDNAFRSHSAMYSPEARRAMTSETRGQNSWVNYGEYGEQNQTATTADTVFAPQKAGLLPEWVEDPNLHNPQVRKTYGWKNAGEMGDSIYVIRTDGTYLEGPEKKKDHVILVWEHYDMDLEDFDESERVWEWARCWSENGIFTAIVFDAQMAPENSIPTNEQRKTIEKLAGKDACSSIRIIYPGEEQEYTVANKMSWWKESDISEFGGDPFGEDYEYEEPTTEEKWNQRYETTILNQLDGMGRSALFSAIMEAGGLRTGDLREEYRSIPNTFKRRDGLPGDEMAEHLSYHYPELGINNENDLIQAMSRRYTMSWWKQAVSFDEYGRETYDENERVSIDKEKPGMILKRYSFDEMGNTHTYQILLDDGSLTDVHRSRISLEGMEMEPEEYETRFRVGDFVEYLGKDGKIYPATIIDSNEGGVYKIKYMDSGADQHYQELDEARVSPENDLVNKFFGGDVSGDGWVLEQSLRPFGNDLFKNSSWWKQTSPHFQENEQGMFDLKMDPEDNPKNWQSRDFRVGDEVTYLPTGEGAHVEETLDVDLYSVMLDSGEHTQATIDELEPSGNESMWDTQRPDTGVERFIGDDPEAQNWEDTTFAGEYSFSETLENGHPPLETNDWVHVYNPDTANEDYIDLQGMVVDNDGEVYEVNIDGNIVFFHRDELELVGKPDNNTLSWWKGSAPIRFSPEDVQPGDEGFSVPWGATQDEAGNYVPSVPDRNKKNPKKLKKDNTPEVTSKDLERHGLTQDKMTENIKRAYYAASPDMIEDGAGWYDEAQAIAQKMVDEWAPQTGITLEQVIGIQSAISPMLSWEQNERYPNDIISEYMIKNIIDPMEWRDSKLDGKTGIRLKLSIIPENRNKCVRIMNGEPLEGIFKGPKTRTFLANIAGRDRDNATVDVWATRVAFGETLPRSLMYSPKSGDYISYYAPSNAVYPVFNEAYREATRQINEETGNDFDVAQIQAITWLAYQKLSPPKSSDLPHMTIDDIEQHYSAGGAPVPVMAKLGAWWTAKLPESSMRKNSVTSTNFVVPGADRFVVLPDGQWASTDWDLHSDLMENVFDIKTQLYMSPDDPPHVRGVMDEYDGMWSVFSFHPLTPEQAKSLMVILEGLRLDPEEKLQVAIEDDDEYFSLEELRKYLQSVAGIEADVTAGYKETSVSSVAEALHGIYETMGFLDTLGDPKGEEVTEHLRNALSELEHMSSLETTVQSDIMSPVGALSKNGSFEEMGYNYAMGEQLDVFQIIDPQIKDEFWNGFYRGIKEKRNSREAWWTMKSPESSMSKGAKGFGDTADWMIEQVQSGVLTHEAAKEEIEQLMATMDDEKDVFEMRAKLRVLEQVSAMPQPEMNPDPYMDQPPMEESQNGMEMMPRRAWWKDSEIDWSLADHDYFTDEDNNLWEPMEQEYELSPEEWALAEEMLTGIDPKAMPQTEEGWEELRQQMLQDGMMSPSPKRTLNPKTWW